MPGPGPGAVVYRRDAGIDAIDQYSQLLVAAIRRQELDAEYVPGGLRDLSRLGVSPAWVLLQYNPFRYGRWGFAPRLLLEACQLRRAHVPLTLMVHEAWLDMTDWRTSVMGLWQRLQLRALMRDAKAVTTSTQAIAETLGHGAIHLPVAANIAPAAEITSQEARERIGLQRPMVVTLFGRNHPSRALEYAEAAIEAIARAHGQHNLTVLNLGADAPSIVAPEAVELRTSGPLPSAELSLMLCASDLILLPLADGVSTRRSTLMAAFAHRLPVVGLSGKNTDQVLLEADDALVLTPAGDIAAFALAAAELSTAPERMRAVGEAGHRLYSEQFDWPVIAARIIALLENLHAGRAPS